MNLDLNLTVNLTVNNDTASCTLHYFLSIIKFKAIKEGERQ